MQCHDVLGCSEEAVEIDATQLARVAELLDLLDGFLRSGNGVAERGPLPSHHRARPPATAKPGLLRREPGHPHWGSFGTAYQWRVKTLCGGRWVSRECGANRRDQSLREETVGIELGIEDRHLESDGRRRGEQWPEQFDHLIEGQAIRLR